MQDTAEFWESRNKGKGTAPIALSESTDVERNQQSSDLASQATLREWCEKYAADPGMLKAFTVPIQFWGWNLEALGTGKWQSSFAHKTGDRAVLTCNRHSC